MKEAAVLMLEIDRQTYFNKLQYDRTLSPEQRIIIEERLQIAEREHRNLDNHAIYNTDSPQQQ
jgi:hypothetical protein